MFSLRRTSRGPTWLPVPRADTGLVEPPGLPDTDDQGSVDRPHPDTSADPTAWIATYHELRHSQARPTDVYQSVLLLLLEVVSRFEMIGGETEQSQRFSRTIQEFRGQVSAARTMLSRDRAHINPIALLSFEQGVDRVFQAAFDLIFHHKGIQRGREFAAQNLAAAYGSLPKKKAESLRDILKVAAVQGHVVDAIGPHNVDMLATAAIAAKARQEPTSGESVDE